MPRCCGERSILLAESTTGSAAIEMKRASGGKRPATHCRMVVFPAPEGPKMTVTPAGAVNSMSKANLRSLLGAKAFSSLTSRAFTGHSKKKCDSARTPDREEGKKKPAKRVLFGWFFLTFF